MRRSLGHRTLAAAALAGLALLVVTGSALASTAHHGHGKGKHGRHHAHDLRAQFDRDGRGRHGKVTVCHNGHPITIAWQALRAHVRHGDDRGHCLPTPKPTPPTGTTAASLTVITHVVNDSGGTKTAADFRVEIGGVTVAGGNGFDGSETGVTRTLSTLGSYTVGEITVSGYTVSASGDCSGTIAAGEHKTCTLTNDDIAAA